MVILNYVDGYFKSNILPGKRLINYKSIIFSHEIMQQWRVNYWDIYAQVVNWIILRSLLSIQKYKQITEQINSFFTCPSHQWSWYVCLHEDYYRNWSWRNQKIMGYKFEQFICWYQTSKWKLVWSSKNCLINKCLSSITSLVLVCFT